MRPSLSLAGAMVLSVVVDGVIKHMALDGNQLDTRSLEARSSPPISRQSIKPKHLSTNKSMECHQLAEWAMPATHMRPCTHMSLLMKRKLTCCQPGICLVLPLVC